MADTFKIRIEMRQIGARQEAGLIGGIGPCGRELCCAQWIRNFVSVSTNSVRYQEISVNPLKLAGQCSKLKCCLNYELDTYLDAWDAFPKVRQLETINGTIFLQKTDVLKGVMYFSAADSQQIFPIPIEKVKEMLDGNKKGEKSELYIDTNEIDSEFKSAVGEDSLTRFDKNRRKRKSRKKSGANNGKPQENVSNSKPQENGNAGKPQQNTNNKPQQNTNNKPQQNGNVSKPQESANNSKPQENANNGKPRGRRNNRPRNNRNRKNDNKNQS
jgi:hypothetical protein